MERERNALAQQLAAGQQQVLAATAAADLQAARGDELTQNLADAKAAHIDVVSSAAAMEARLQHDLAASQEVVQRLSAQLARATEEASKMQTEAEGLRAALDQGGAEHAALAFHHNLPEVAQRPRTDMVQGQLQDMTLCYSNAAGGIESRENEDVLVSQRLPQTPGNDTGPRVNEIRVWLDRDSVSKDKGLPAPHGPDKLSTCEARLAIEWQLNSQANGCEPIRAGLDNSAVQNRVAKLPASDAALQEAVAKLAAAQSSEAAAWERVRGLIGQATIASGWQSPQPAQLLGLDMPRYRGHTIGTPMACGILALAQRSNALQTDDDSAPGSRVSSGPLGPAESDGLASDVMQSQSLDITRHSSRLMSVPAADKATQTDSECPVNGSVAHLSALDPSTGHDVVANTGRGAADAEVVVTLGNVALDTSDLKKLQARCNALTSEVRGGTLP